MLTKDEIISLLQLHKTYLQERFGLETLVLFGSYSRGEQKESSDIDLVYGSAKGNSMPFMRIERLEQFISTLFNGTKIELVPQNYIEPIIGESVKKEGIVVF